MDGIPPVNTNEWPQNQSNEKAAMMPQASTGRVMEKPSHEQQLQQQQQQQPPLKCPRCDSTNTKFCYYNNYSLSQPRHFCKACKRYWTRGGTLRNVPVGGGCRRNKRVKRPASVMDGSSPLSAAPSANQVISSSVQSHMDISSSASNHVSPLLFGLPNNPSEMSLSYSRFNTKASNMDGTISGYDHLQPQFNALGLGFSSGIMSNAACNSYITNGFDSNRMNQDLVNSKSLLSSYSSLFGNSHSPATSSPSLLASTLHQHKFMNVTDLKETLAPNNVQVFESQVACTNSEAKDMKAEGQNRLEWNVPYHNQAEQIGSMPDPSMYWNATTNVGSWHDPTNMGSSSVSSLI